MKKQYLLLTVALLVNITIALSQTIYQSIYEIKFGLSAKSNKDYTALVIRNSDGAKYLRVIYKNNKTKLSTAYELIFFENSTDFANAAKTIKPTLLYGKDSSACLPVFFNYFSAGRYDAKKKEASVYKNKKILPAFISSSTPLRREDIKADYIKKFFLENEEFYLDFIDPTKQQTQSTPWFYYISIANTLDSAIGAGCKKDLESVSPLFKRIPFELDLPIKEITVLGPTFSKQSVLNAINSIQPKKQDIVVFYYTGHGFSYKDDDKVKFPQLDLRSNPPVYDEKIIKASTRNIGEVFEMIKNKGARLNLVIGDCCNNEIEFYRKWPNPIQVTREPTIAPNRIEMANLFLKHKANILMAAANKEQYAVVDDLLGSLFTFQFSNKLIAALWGKANNVTWEYIIEQTNTATLNMSKGYNCSLTNEPKACYQQPIFKIE
ncbi:MAG: caspase family protein [Ferruginibacter sp.]|nr:caspase family protein [Ferruginibacter sp.]